MTKKEVTIDIGKNEADRTYQDDRNNSIKVEKGGSLSGLSGYKRYTHTPVTGPYCIGGIYYNRVKQDSIRVTDSGLYKKRVTVYYLGYDESNLVPLIVGLEKTWLTDQYYYYKKDDYFATSSRWTDEERDVNQESKLTEKLPGISTQLKQFVVLNLGQTQGRSYYANGTDNAPTINGTLQIKVTGPDYIHTIYKKYKHAPGGGISAIRPLSTKSGGKNIPFESPVYGTEYREAYVYFWEGDSRHRNPLLLELKQTTSSSSYYTLADTDERTGKKWKTESGIRDGNLKRVLDRENCNRNDAHIINITEKGGGPDYTCPGCSKPITVTNYPDTGYSYSGHHIIGGHFRIFKDNTVEQTGITPASITPTSTRSTVYVYWYPKGSYEIPLLIYIREPSNKWFERETLDSSNWTEVQEKPGNYKEDLKIPKLLKAKLPTVTINVGYKTGLETSESSTSYEDNSEGGEEGKQRINVKRKNIEAHGEGPKYVGFTHSVQDKTYFVVKDVQYNTSTLPGIPLTFILTSVTAYYSDTDFTLNSLLLVELEKRSGPKNYAYYYRDNQESNWTLLDGEEKADKLDSSLTDKLKELKRKLEDKEEATPQGGEESRGVDGQTRQESADGDGHHSASAGVSDPFIDGLEKFWKQIDDFFQKPEGKISGGAVSGILGTSILGFGTWKLWPKIMSCLITKTL